MFLMWRGREHYFFIASVVYGGLLGALNIISYLPPHRFSDLCRNPVIEEWFERQNIRLGPPAQVPSI